ncbi:MAG TPA: enoyl-CoA hydratase/isomerase family protein [Clostridia bacterium]|nr:enoyl-CoA hydratase/isomerase family protein [Clostridia bacterium]
MTDKSGCLKWEEAGHIGIIRISSPPRNFLPRPEFANIQVVRQWIEQKHILGIILTGEGRHFSAGADLEYFEHSSMVEFILEFRAGRALLDYLENLEKPVIASIDGVCLGGGLELALACHLRYCSERAIFGFPEINHSLMPGLGGVARLVKTAGRSKSLEILLTGDTFDARTALSLGIVNGIVDPSNALNAVMNIITRIVENGEKPVSYCLRAVKNSSSRDFASASIEESKMFGELVIGQYGGLVKSGG